MRMRTRQRCRSRVDMRHSAVPSDDMDELLIHEKLDSRLSIVHADSTGEREVLAGLSGWKFDYHNGPLIKLFLLKSEHEHKSCKLVIVAHHFIADGWSLSLFCEELIEAYNGLRTGVQPAFSEAMDYSEYMKKKEAELKAEKQTGRASVLEKLFAADCDQELALPNHQIMALPGEGKGERLTFTTDELWLKKVRKTAAAAKCSPFMDYAVRLSSNAESAIGAEAFCSGRSVCGTILDCTQSTYGELCFDPADCGADE